MNIRIDTNERIIHAAIELFISQGLRKTSMEEVAHHAGVSRVTIYRYYNDRKELVRTVIMRAADVFRRIRESVTNETPKNPAILKNLFQEELGKISNISFLGKFDELRRVYPDLYDEYRAIRKDALDIIFEQLLMTLKRDGLLRKGINETVLRYLFFDTIVNAIENTKFSGLNIPREQIIGTIHEVFLHGIINAKALDRNV